MPELPDITIYLEALETRVRGRPLERVRLASPFLLRTFSPPLSRFEGRRVEDLDRLGKRIVFGFEGGLYLVLHLMIAGRLRWRGRKARVPGRIGLAAFDFPEGTLLLTEASKKKRAALHAVEGEEALRGHDPGGIDVLSSTLEEFQAAMTRENRTLKRALTDPRILSGVGNAFSDEVLHAAGMSPTRRTRQLEPADWIRLHGAAQVTLSRWIDQLRREVGIGFPEKVTAFREGMAVHGRFGKPCPTCGTPVQRIVYAENESNYCPKCQTGGKLLRDRALSQLLKSDWPRTVEEMEDLKAR